MSVSFLLSKPQMKNLQMTLDIAGETATVTIDGNKQEIPIDGMSGHLRMRMFTEIQVEAFERLEKGVADGQLAFPTEAREEKVAELKDFPATFVAGQGEKLQSGAIELSHENTEKIRNQLWRAGGSTDEKVGTSLCGSNEISASVPIQLWGGGFGSMCRGGLRRSGGPAWRRSWPTKSLNLETLT